MELVKEKVLSVEKLVKVNAYIASTLAYIIIFPYISPIYSFAFSILLLTALYKDFYKYFTVSRFILNTVGIFLVLLMTLQINPDNIVQPALDTITVLLGLKLLEDKKFRDYMQVYLIVALILSGYTLLSISMVFLLYLVFFVFFLNYGVILLSYYQKDPSLTFDLKQLRSFILKTSLIPVFSIPITVFLFFALPRTSYPMLTFLQGQGKGKTGFSDNVSLGDVSSIQQDDSVVARVVMKKVGEVYLRGVVFDYFDGKRWQSQEKFLNTKFTRLSGQKVEYTVYLEPTYQQYLFSVDIPYNITSPTGFILFRNQDLTYKVDKPITSKVRYEGESFITDSYYQELNSSIYLQLPQISSDIVNLAKQLKKQTPQETAQEISNYLQNFSYSLKDLPSGENPLEDFLFKTKKGNCEYFASAMAVLLRLNGIPSRLVGGYKTSAYNEIGGYYIFREKDAHVWVESYIDGRWVKFDPTPPIRNVVVESLYRQNFIKQWLELIDYYYTTFIVNYDFSKQIQLINKIKSNFTNTNLKLSFSLNKNFLAAAFLFLIFIYLVYVFIKHLSEPYEKRVLNLFLKKMKKLGYEKKENEGLEEFVLKIDNPNIKEKALNFVKAYESFLFKDIKITEKEFNYLKELLKDL
ncbi:putative membrane protein [Sulfurihydrogenibium azorense Az-Fu1]|jgi:transglutaminase-like putative cysteine protease|uniref:Putative membrane protein n=1 Tax=Sulfurihydrogenibium azorense (strain DSM 15241 / OCM 825 / Az-Fu1) TaxID=204536 RepID=C1DXA6_SULAA|nr:DUF3488 and transglutaminase-like domain-containing protein [Sulfurihydrogenibium azorense]ACN98968.1 putative membrane protein [Sulfurihydrogenibium azorense Az-Fu1]